MSHQASVNLNFENVEQYEKMKSQLEQAGLTMDGFSTYCVNLVWNQMLAEYQKQLAAAEEDKQIEAELLEEFINETAGDEPERNTESLPNAEGMDS